MSDYLCYCSTSKEWIVANIDDIETCIDVPECILFNCERSTLQLIKSKQVEVEWVKKKLIIDSSDCLSSSYVQELVSKYKYVKLGKQILESSIILDYQEYECYFKEQGDEVLGLPIEIEEEISYLGSTLHCIDNREHGTIFHHKSNSYYNLKGEWNVYQNEGEEYYIMYDCDGEIIRAKEAELVSYSKEEAEELTKIKL